MFISGDKYNAMQSINRYYEYIFELNNNMIIIYIKYGRNDNQLEISVIYGLMKFGF